MADSILEIISFESYYSGELLLNSKKKTKLRHHMEASSAHNVFHTRNAGFTSRDGGQDLRFCIQCTG